MMENVSTFQSVSYLWDPRKAAALAGDEIGLLIYRSNLLGADLRLTNYGGGNTSCKVSAMDPLSAAPQEILWVKGSGGDLGTLTRKGLSALYLSRLNQLKLRYRGLEEEDAMVPLFGHCLFDLQAKAPSIDTPLHAFLPFKHIDHLHPDAVIAIAASKDGEKITRELFEGTIGWIPWQRPGFDLGLTLEKYVREHPGIRGLILGSHGLFTWGNSSLECYNHTLSVVERCASYIEEKKSSNRVVFGGAKLVSPEPEFRRQQAAAIAPVLRGFCSAREPMIGHFTDTPAVLEFINSQDMERLAVMGTSCPDHFLRTKIRPLVLSLSAREDLSEPAQVSEKIAPAFEQYRRMYRDYYESCKHPDSPAMRDPNPVVIIYPGIGIFTFAKNKPTARIAAEFYCNAINVMRGAETISSYTSLPSQEAFNIEYWQLEEAKLQRMPKPKPLSGKVALVTGSAGGIGKAIAKKFAREGACVIINDNHPGRLEAANLEFAREFGGDVFITQHLDVTNAETIDRTLREAILSFGGVDILVNNAGLSVSKSLADQT